jgi:hypothetical protein
MRGIKLFILVSIICLLGGCCGLKEGTKGFLGVSTKVLEDKRSEAVTKDFAGDIPTIHDKIKNILKYEGSYIYKDDLSNNLIAIYISEKDTTPVGIFLTEIDKNNIQVEVSSPSIYGKETIADIIFGTLDGTRKPKSEKGNEDAEKKGFWSN